MKNVNFVCEECGTENTKRVKDQAHPRFCSVQCNNLWLGRSRRKPGRTCSGCGKYKWGKGIQDLCRACYRQDMDTRTLQDLRDSVATTYEYHAKLRGLSRQGYQGPRACVACGYDLHVDFCHIRPVSDFPMTALVSEVNAQDNIVALDKRCHWEFDHGYLVLPGKLA
jgi:hypothetical protein